MTSLRSVGYTLNTAIADLIDNALSAGATTVALQAEWAGGDSWIAIEDDGEGLSPAALREALRLGSSPPGAPRAATDLGRFGLGLKTASISQARRFAVHTRTPAGATTAGWCLDELTRTGQWRLRQDYPPETTRRLTPTLQGPTGTRVVWEQLDRLVEPDVPAQDSAAHQTFLRRLAALKAHLGLVFHRFIDGDTLASDALRLTLNGRPIEAWDPFRCARSLPTLTLEGAGPPTRIKGYVQRHRGRLDTPEDFVRLAGPGATDETARSDWSRSQGFYIYRGRRLLVAGGWLGLRGLRREAHFDLARIAIDLDNTHDEHWQIDVMKSRARIPRACSAPLADYARRVREEALKVYRHRGRLEAREDARATEVIWQRLIVHDRTVWQLNRQHPLLRDLAEGLPSELRRRLETTLRAIETTVPVDAILVAGADDLPDLGDPGPPPAELQAEIIERLTRLTRALGDARLARENLSQIEPFDSYARWIHDLPEPPR